MAGKIHLTREGFDKFQEELEYLKGEKRRAISKDIAEARALGDLSENAEYHTAREHQAMNERRVREIENILSDFNHSVEVEVLVYEELNLL